MLNRFSPPKPPQSTPFHCADDHCANTRRNALAYRLIPLISAALLLNACSKQAAHDPIRAEPAAVTPPSGQQANTLPPAKDATAPPTSTASASTTKASTGTASNASPQPAPPLDLSLPGDLELATDAIDEQRHLDDLFQQRSNKRLSVKSRVLTEDAETGLSYPTTLEGLQQGLGDTMSSVNGGEIGIEFKTH